MVASNLFLISVVSCKPLRKTYTLGNYQGNAHGLVYLQEDVVDSETFVVTSGAYVGLGSTVRHQD